MNSQYKQLTLCERYQIESLRELGFSARKIADKMARGNKTIARELKRCPENDYAAEVAHAKATAAKSEARKFAKRGQVLIDKVKGCLKYHLSPEQIAGRIAKEQPSLKVCYNTIYRMINEQGWQYMLARKGKPYKPRKGSEAGVKLIPNRVGID